MGHRGAWVARARNAGAEAHRVLVAERPAWVLSVGVVAAVLIFVSAVLGWGYISGTGAYWHQPLYDSGTHLSGWLFFQRDSWHFPIFDTARLNYPDGGSIILTDSIPLVALVAKLVGLGVSGWQYFGLFVAGAYVLNAVALLWLLRQMGARNIVAALVAVSFACFTTLYNIQFESFFAQFLVILSLGFYVRLRHRFRPKELGLFAVMVVATLLIHPYLFAMSLGIFGVSIVTLWRRGQLSLAASAGWVAGILVALAVVGWASGYLAHPATGYQEKLYGTSPLYALDLSALFQKAYTVDEIGTYLGAGFWVLAIAGLVLLWRRRSMLASNVWLAALCVLFVLIALSSTLFVGGHALFHVGLPTPLATVAEMFRASKRFIVPVYYVVLAVDAVLLLRARSRWGVAIILVALVLQIADTSYYVRGLHDAAQRGQVPVLDQAQWKGLIGTADVVQVFPSYSCLFDYRKAPLSGQWAASLELYQLTAQAGKISNSVRASRRTKDCSAEARQAQGTPPTGNLYIYLTDDAKRFIIQPPQRCLDQQHTFDCGVYCTVP